MQSPHNKHMINMFSLTIGQFHDALTDLPVPIAQSMFSLTNERRHDVKAVSQKHDHGRGALLEGDAVRVFSKSADVWVAGEVVQIVEGYFVCVEYEVDELPHRKSLHLCSVHLDSDNDLLRKLDLASSYSNKSKFTDALWKLEQALCIYNLMDTSGLVASQLLKRHLRPGHLGPGACKLRESCMQIKRELHAMQDTRELHAN